MADLHAIRIEHGEKTGFVAGTIKNIEIVESAYDALYWPRDHAEMLADGIEDALGWSTWLVAAPEGSTVVSA